MVEVPLPSCSPLAGRVSLGRHGMAEGALGVVMQERTGLQIATMAARRGQAPALAQAMRVFRGLDLPNAPRRVGDAAFAVLWAGAETWLVMAQDWPGDLEAALRSTFGAFAAIADQSDGRVVLRVSGARARDALAKGMAIDLHPRAFQPGDTALTLAAHIGVQIWLLDDTPCFELAAFRGYAGSLIDWLVSAGAEYGIEIVTPG